MLVGLIFRNWKIDIKVSNNKSLLENEKVQNVSITDFGRILGDAIRKSISTILNIGGFVVIFSVIISILNSGGFFTIIGNICEVIGLPKVYGISFFSGIIELTNGIKSISLIQTTKMSLCMTSFLLGFGGLSVLLQVYSIISKERISIKPYFYGKILQGVLSFLIMSVLI